jgi:hypothetical protein
VLTRLSASRTVLYSIAWRESYHYQTGGREQEMMLSGAASYPTERERERESELIRNGNQEWRGQGVARKYLVRQLSKV